jgi:hypothetical protein
MVSNLFHVVSCFEKIQKNEMGGACGADGEKRGVYRVWWGNLGERDHWGDPDVDGRIILGRIFRKWDVGYGLDWAGSGYRQVAGTCECNNKPSLPIK